MSDVAEGTPRLRSRRRGGAPDPVDVHLRDDPQIVGDRRGAPRRPVLVSRHARHGGRRRRARDAARTRRRCPIVDAASGQVVAEAERVHPGRVLRGADRRTGPSRFRIGCGLRGGGEPHEFDDVYRFPPVLGDLDLHLLAEGSHLESHRKLGAHLIDHEGIDGVAFAVWAPNARRVSVVGDFERWDGRRMPMRRRHAGGFWEIFVPGLRAGQLLQIRDTGRPTAPCCRSRPIPTPTRRSCRRAPRRSSPRRRATSGRTASG